MTVAREAIDILERLLPTIEAALDAAVPPEGGLAVMARYHLGWCDVDGRPARNRTGKRIRPALVLLAAEAAGGALDDAVPAAVAVELLHNFSLIHDDIQDRSPSRHGRPTVWAVWGEAQAINAGNVLHVLAHRSLAALADRRPTVGRRALERLYETSLRLCDGQYLDLIYEQRPVIQLNEYVPMIAGKTASLIALTLELGAMAATDDATVWAAYRQVGEDLGLAFQIWDDYLGAWGDPAATGKPVGEDIANRKKTLPIAYAFEQATGPDAQVLTDAYRPGAPGPAQVAAVLEVLERVGARAYTERRASELIDQALRALDRAPGHPDRLADLATVARYLVGRDR